MANLPHSSVVLVKSAEGIGRENLGESKLIHSEEPAGRPPTRDLMVSTLELQKKPLNVP
jgi:hypothetical protein